METGNLLIDTSILIDYLRKIIETKDLFIGATALSHGLPLMTLNIKHFERIEALKIV